MESVVEYAPVPENLFESKSFTQSLERVNQVISRLRTVGGYEGPDLCFEDFEVVRFPDMSYAHGAVNPESNKIRLLPSAFNSPNTVVHESLHAVSNWKFKESNAVRNDNKYQSGFYTTRIYDDEQSAGESPTAFRALNEGFTEYLARIHCEGLEDETEQKRSEMLVLCEDQFNEEILRTRVKIDALKAIENLTDLNRHNLNMLIRDIEYLEAEKQNMLWSLQHREEVYASETVFVGDYLLKKAIKLRSVLPEPRPSLNTVLDTVRDQAEVAYATGDTTYLNDLDELYAPGALIDFKEASNSREFSRAMVKYT